MTAPSAIVLAAGFSSRMGGFKPLLALSGRTFLERCVTAFRLAGVEDVVVVTGHRGDEVRAAAAALGARTVVNQRYADGMYTSVQAGAAAVPATAPAFFLLPVDTPLVRSETIGRLARAAGAGAADVVLPVHRDAPGHPPLLAAVLRAAILAAEPPGGLRTLLAEHNERTLRVEVADPGVSLDADTPEDSARLAEAARGEDLPDEARCLTLLAEQGSSPSVMAHSRAVAVVASTVAAALNERDQHLCLPLVTSGALLHDVARAEPDHARAGAALLERLGYARLAPVVARHMRLGLVADPDEAADLDEALVVYLADKLVEEDRYVGLERRFAARLESFGADAAARAAVTERRAEAEQARRLTERALGRPLSKLLASA